MSTPRLLLLRVAAASRRTLNNLSPHGHQAFKRWQSAKPARSVPRGFRAGRLATYTITASGLAVGGALVYANYDPVFKNRVNEYVPGFAQLADTAADLIVNRMDSIYPHGGMTGDQSRVGRVKVGRVFGEKKKEQEIIASSPQSTDAVVGETAGVEYIATYKDQLSEPKLEQETADPIQAKTQKDAKQEKESPAVPVETTAALEQSEETAEGAQPNEEVTRETVQEKVESVVEGGRGGVERVVEEVKGEVERVAGEVREEKVREQQEAQMADQQLNWLKDSAQVEEKLEKTFQDFVSQTAMVAEAQNNVVTSSREHGRLVKVVTSDVAGDLQSARDTAGAMYRAEEAVQASRESLKDAVELGLKSKVEEVEAKVRECVGGLAEGTASMQQAETERELLQDYKKQAQRDREQLQRELGQELPEGDSRQEAVLVMLGRRVEVLKQKLQGMEKEYQERLTAALERQKASLEELGERRLEWSLRDKEKEMQQELGYRADKIHREYQSELREQLKRQTDSHNQLLTDSLNTQAEQLAGKWSAELELKLIEQESHYQKELALTLSRLRGIEYMVNTIAAAGNETKRQQSMRAACDSLHTALQSASASPDPDERYSLLREVSTLRNVAKDDPFILAILYSLPARAVSVGGIQGEGGLRERFAKVKRICRRVALVPERGGGMGTYALSYLQSLLIISWRFVGRIGGEGEMDDEDLMKLNTFDILERAEACMRQGDMELAVRYINLLQGEPRNVARDWLCDARSYLEISQAVRLMSEYMAALNITASATATKTN